MIELIKNWLLGVTCAAMVVSLAEGLTPPGTVRKIGRLTGGLVLLLAILQPILRVDSGTMAQSLAEYRAAMSNYSVELEETDLELMKGIIAEQSGAYILDKAMGLGITCTVEVRTEPGEGAYPVPWSVTVRGNLSPEQQTALTRQIEADFAIPAERQSYQSETGEGA